MASRFEQIIGSMTEDETAEAAELALRSLPEARVVEVIKSWAAVEDFDLADLAEQ